MIARALLAFALAAFAAAPALAAEGAGVGVSEGPDNRIRASFTLQADAPDTGAQGYGPEGEAGPRAVDIPTLSIPAFADGELHGYMFISVRLLVKEGRDPWRIREKAHLLRDALIRAGHRTALMDPDNPTRLDAERARQVISEGLSELVHMDDIERIEFLSVDAHAG